MIDKALSLTYTSSRQDKTCLLLEQKPWSRDVGRTSELQAIVAISAAANGGRWPEVFCGGLNGVFNATVYVYPCDDISYQFRVSHGVVVGSTIETLYREEIIQASFKLQHEPDYPVKKMARMSWIGQCYDQGGAVVNHPAAEYADGVIELSRPVYGSLRIRYTVLRHVYEVQVTKRANSLENKYQAVAFVVFSGGVEWLDIEAPAGFEAFDGDCGNGAFYGSGLPPGYNPGDLSQTKICDDEYHKLPVAVSADRAITVDYCSQVKISDIIIEDVEWESVRVPCDDD